MIGYPVLTLTTFLPLVGAALILLVASKGLARWIALATTLATLAVSAPLYQHFDKASSALQFVESRDWIPSFNIAYDMGVDGISLPFIFLAALLSILCVGASWTAVQTRVEEFYAALLVAETAMIGLFAASNLLLFFIFWELMLVPVFLLIGVWGGPQRVYAAVKFLIFTLSGSVLMLVGIIALYQTAGTLEFKALAGENLQPEHQAWLFVAFLAAFAVKVPMFPVHTWLPNAHTEAPTAGSVILAGILLKMGAYGFLRVSIPILPDAVELFLPAMLAVSAVAIVYGAYVTLVQNGRQTPDRLFERESHGLRHAWYLHAQSERSRGGDPSDGQPWDHLRGSLPMRRHDLRAYPHARDQGLRGSRKDRAGLFDVAGAVLPGRRGLPGFECVRRGIPESSVAPSRPGSGWGPWRCGVLPWERHYVVWLYYRVVMGELNPGLEGLRLELNAREVATLAPLAVLALSLGLYPELVLSYLRAPVAELLGAGVLP